MTEPHCIWPLACTLGEGPLWWDGALWFTDIKACQVHRFDPVSQTGKSWDAPSPIGFLVPRAKGGFLTGSKSGLLDFDPETGAFAFRGAVEPDRPDNRLNDGMVDTQGRLWFGSMHDGETQATGALYRLDGRGLAVMEDGIGIPNGPAVTPDGRTLYHADSAAQCIYAFDLDDAGELSNRRLFAQIEGCHPDGCVVDSEGCLWTGLYDGWGVRRYAPSGEKLTEVRFPTANVTKIAFGGVDLKTVYATTARQGVDAKDQPLAGGLFRFQADVAGQAAVAFVF